VELVAVDPVRLGEGARGLPREWIEVETFDTRARAQPAEDDSQRVQGFELIVAIGREHERSGRLDTAAEQAEEVERRLVRPVDVLEHEDCRARQLVEQRRRHLVRAGSALEQLGERSADLGRDVCNRRKRTRREERVACSREDAHATCVVAEGADERGLPDAGLAGEEGEPPIAALRLVQQVGQAS
jgi:hypothetical protein